MAATFQVLVKIEWIFSVLMEGAAPLAARLGIGNSLEQPCRRALFGQDDKNRARFAFTFAEHCCEPAGGFDCPDQARNLELCGQARGYYAASFSIELTSRP